MKPQTRVRDYASNVQGEDVKMSIDESALSHIMSVLTDLYSDTEMAVIREYATNALDAHVEAGVSRPIEISLPTALSPFFKIRDFGTGLNAEDIREIYSRYGTSTKRASNDVIGMLGLGCKSALTYSDQFTVTSTKAGRTIQVLVSRDEDGAGSMTIVSDTADDREQGTEIIVPVKRHNGFETKSASFFRFWKDGTVLVNGEAPSRIDGLWLNDDKTLLLTRDSDKNVVVMGNVAYPFLDDVEVPTYGGSYSNRYHIVAFVGIGEVAFTPSREALQATKQTREALRTIIDGVAKARDAAVVKQVAAAKDAAEAVNLLQMGRDLGFKGDAHFKGKVVPLRFDRTPKVKGPDGQMVIDRHGMNDPKESKRSFLYSGGRYAKVNGDRSWSIDFTDSKMWFEGFTAKQLSPVKREKIALWLHSKGLDHGSMVFVDTLSTDERFWLNGSIHQWDDVEAMEIPKDHRPEVPGLGRPRGSYTAIVDGTQMEVQAADIDTSKPVIWMHGNQYHLSGNKALQTGVVNRNVGTIVALSENRIPKFQRDFPMAVEVDAQAKANAQAWEAAQSEEDKEAFAFQHAHRDSAAKLKGLDPLRVKDPAVKRGIELSQRNVTAYSTARNKFGVYLDGWYNDVKSKTPDPLVAYPLILFSGYGYSPSKHDEHSYLYLNTVYAAAQAVAQARKDVAA